MDICFIYNTVMNDATQPRSLYQATATTTNHPEKARKKALKINQSQMETRKRRRIKPATAPAEPEAEPRVVW
ncbi:hypothetical protein MHYP_G00289100 [Metynnis hypsauchen]